MKYLVLRGEHSFDGPDGVQTIKAGQTVELEKKVADGLKKYLKRVKSDRVVKGNRAVSGDDCEP